MKPMNDRYINRVDQAKRDNSATIDFLLPCSTQQIIECSTYPPISLSSSRATNPDKMSLEGTGTKIGHVWVFEIFDARPKQFGFSHRFVRSLDHDQDFHNDSFEISKCFT
jgi:hypothetical protein